MSKQQKKTCGNCATTQPFNDTHIRCCNMECKSCGCLKGVNSGGCKCWTDPLAQTAKK